jgi:hypothetical protein
MRMMDVLMLLQVTAIPSTGHTVVSASSPRSSVDQLIQAKTVGSSSGSAEAREQSVSAYGIHPMVNRASDWHRLLYPELSIQIGSQNSHLQR